MRPFVKLFITLIVAPIIFTTSYAAEPCDADTVHEKFDKVLQTHVSNGQVNYAGIQQDKNFYDYLAILEKTDPNEFDSEKKQLAFWINAYNALTIKGILDGLSPSSLFGRITFFKTTQYKVAGRSMSLDDLEKKTIIPYGEPRIHFAIVCASFSCPPLRSEAYKASTLGAQLEENADIFLNDNTKNQFNADKKVAKLSKIFDWFKDDFVTESESLQQYVSKYVNNKTIANQLAANDYKVNYLKYDWSLNGTPPKKK